MAAPLTPRAVILAGGEIRDFADVAARLLPGDYIICADSGYDHCAPLGVLPDLLVGDFDSVRASLPPGVERVPFPAEKNYTDTTHALEEALARGYKRLLLAGMLGGRPDHTLANLQSLAMLSRRGVDALLTDGVTDCLALTDGEITLTPKPRHYFSLLAHSDTCTGVNIRDAKYLLHDHTLLSTLPRAISNEFLATPPTISVASGTLFIIITPMDDLL